LLLGGGRALLLQVAHPLVAAGVAAHSDFRRAPLQRLWRTLDLTLTITFADAAHAIAAVRQIERVHARVHGKLKEDIGPFLRGTPYDANDPELLLWVYATLVDTALLVYERFVAPLPSSLRAQYYEESKVAARLFGIPVDLIPPDLGEFRAYMRRMIRGETLAVSSASREIAASILRPPVMFALRPAFRLVNLFTVELLPRTLRRQYRLAWGATASATTGVLATAAQHLLPVLPGLVRELPHARGLR
jgi:uncharacterized protein (DUF2236 family)